MDTTKDRSIARRGVLALALLLGPYLLALGMAGALAALVVRTAAGGGLRAWFLPAILAVYAILAGIFFIERRERAPAGFRIDARSEPRLLALIDEVAEAMSTKVPDEVHLTPDVNAFVYEQGRIFGLVRTRRILGVGLALVNVLTVDELRSVLAHEYGHYVGGDTRLAGIVYRIRASLSRTLTHPHSGFIRGLFAAYGRLFLRLTQPISRDQELAADAAAVRIGSARVHSTALQALTGAGGAFDAFMAEYVVPLWREQHRPDNLYQGFRSFLRDPLRREQILGYIDEVKVQEGELDSHPSLERRLESIPHPGRGEGSHGSPARDLLVHPDTSERMMTEIVSELAAPGSILVPIPWEQTGVVLASRIRGAADRFIDALGKEGLEIEGDRLPRVVVVLERADAAKIVRRLVPLRDYSEEDVDSVVGDTIHYYLSAVLVDDLVTRHGYRVAPSWSRPFLVTGRDGKSVDMAERVARALETRNLRGLLLHR